MFDSVSFDASSFDENSFDLDAVAANDGSFASASFSVESFDDGSFEFDTALPSTEVVFLGAFLETSTTLALYYSDVVEIGSGGSTGIVISLSGGAATVTYASGEGSSKLTYTISRSVSHRESGSGSYTNPGNGIEDTNGNDIDNASFIICNRIPYISVGKPPRRRTYGRWPYF